MNIHRHAALTPSHRERMVGFVLEEGRTLKIAAAAFRVSLRTVGKRIARFRAGGVLALRDRSSRPKRLHNPPTLLRWLEVIALRRQKLTGYEIARRTFPHHGLTSVASGPFESPARLSAAGAGPP